MRTVNRATGEVLLDQLSISQKSAVFCPYGAPLGALKTDEKATIYQTCCNHWSCPVCWRGMAAKLRARVVHGANVLSDGGMDLYFWTFTCRGRNLSLETADDAYYSWTNKALARLRYQANASGQKWVYVQITERQRRGHAHSHFIHTFRPTDATEYPDENGRITLRSASFLAAVVAAGLGNQCQITLIETPGAVAHYISGYLEKHVNSDVFPPHWKRVRWSRDWPDLPEQRADYAGVLRTKADWTRADRQHVQFVAENETVYEYARHHMVNVQNA